jgi:hypothetical protein
MVEQHEWHRNPRIKPGRVKCAGYGRCQACYMRARRHGLLPSVTITSVTRYPVECGQCGPVGEAVSRAQATQLRDGHLATELARLRRAVGLAS